MSANKITWRVPDDDSKVDALLLNIVAPVAKRAVGDKRKIQVTLSEVKRSDEHNARLHAMFTWMSKNVYWAGKKRPVDHWKRLFTAAWLRAQGESVEVLPALDGHGVDVIYEPTSEMSGKQIASLIEYIYFWGAEFEVDIPEVQLDPSTGRYVSTTRLPPPKENIDKYAGADYPQVLT